MCVCVCLVAARVLQKGSHTLSDAKLIARKKPPKDDGKLVLRGVSASTSRDMLELYVENLTGLESDSYTLYQSPGKDLVLVHLHQPAAEGQRVAAHSNTDSTCSNPVKHLMLCCWKCFCTDFEKMCSKVSKRALEGARLTLEQVECTDSIMVGNLTDELTDDLLTLYFESSRSGGGDVTAVSRISQQLAKVSFKDVQCELFLSSSPSQPYHTHTAFNITQCRAVSVQHTAQATPTANRQCPPSHIHHKTVQVS